MTKAELQAELEARGISYPADATKAILEAMLAHPSQTAPVPSQTVRPVWEGGENRSAYHARLRDWKRSR